MRKQILGLFKIVVIALSFYLFINVFTTDPAYSRGGGGGGCFSAGTLILTPEGNKKIEQLHPGDRVLNYNFSAGDRDWGTIERIEVINSSDYYLINDRTKVTGTHPFYIQTEQGLKVTPVQNLHQGDRLIDKDNKLITISKVEHINKKIVVYNLISINPNHNFYADGLLVHNKGGGGGGGGSFARGGGGEYYTITEKNVWGFIKASIILILGLSCIVSWRQIYNLVILGGKKFTEDKELIKFTTDINPNFKNKYSIGYTNDDQIWHQILPKDELPESEYQHIICKAELCEQVSNLFLKYQQDWTAKNFSSMTDYINEPFCTKQQEILKNNFGNNFDIVYGCRLSQIVPIDIKIEEHRYFLRVQINGKMINFKLSSMGYILSGLSSFRSFSEYWDIKLTLSKQCYLVNIRQVNDVLLNIEQ